MPGVTMCYKHNCALYLYDGIHGHELEFPVKSTILETHDKSYEYAVFCKDFLDASLDVNLEDIRTAISIRLKELKYTLYKRLDEDMKDYIPLMNKLPSRFLITTNKSSPYLNDISCLTILCFLFKDVKTLLQYINKNSNVEITFRNKIKNKYLLLSQYRNNIVELECKTCKTKFLTMPFRIISGWGCPKCDGKLTNNSLFKRLFKEEANNDYLLLSEYKSITQPISVKHLTCGKIYSITPRSFILEHNRCTCGLSFNIEDIRNEVENTGEFKLIKYLRTDKPLTIKHLKCGNTFSMSRAKFLKTYNCKICNPKKKTHEIFEQEIYDRVGDEYTLIGTFKDSHTRVPIRHNKCGTVQDYIPHNFLDGFRCSQCKLFLRDDAFARIIKEVSYGKYSFEGKYTSNLYSIKNTETNEIINLPPEKVLQELFRYKPSTILPLEQRNLNVSLISSDNDKLLEYINNTFTQDDIIFFEDLNASGISHVNLKKSIQVLCKRGYLNNFEKGVYVYPDNNITLDDVIKAKYLIRYGNHIGYLAGLSLAYELGLQTEKPERLDVITNKENKTKARNTSYQYKPLKVHGPYTEINNDNYIILATLTFLQTYKNGHYVNTGNINKAFYKWLNENNIILADFEPYYQYYNDLTKSLIEMIYKEGENA